MNLRLSRIVGIIIVVIILLPILAVAETISWGAWYDHHARSILLNAVPDAVEVKEDRMIDECGNSATYAYGFTYTTLDADEVDDWERTRTDEGEELLRYKSSFLGS